MCLAIPGKILSIDSDRMRAVADFEGVEKRVIVALVPKVKEGDYVIVHAGSAISIMDAQQAQESLELWRDLIEKGEVDKSDLI